MNGIGYLLRLHASSINMFKNRIAKHKWTVDKPWPSIA